MQFSIRAAALALFPAVFTLSADPLHCNLTDYKASPGLTAQVMGETLVVLSDGDKNQELRLRFAIRNAAPIVQDMAIRNKGGAWIILAADAAPDFRVASGLRRITNQQLDPLAGLGVKITPEVVNQDKWEAFWDAPLNLPGGESAHNNNTPPHDGVLDQPGLPRSPGEIHRASAVYHADRCDVKTDGARLEISFPGVQLGVFAGRLQYTVYKGTNLIRQEIIARTDQPSVAYKYEAGITGIHASRLAWRDTSNQWTDHAPSPDRTVVKANNRLIAADLGSGSLAAFPPPHTFFWARETDYNLGYTWYARDSFGVRQADSEESASEEDRGSEDRHQNFALLSARPGTWQRMPVYFYAGLGTAQSTIDAALAFTHADHFAPLPGYKVMATHFHMGLVANAARNPKVRDLEVMKAAGIQIVAPIDGGSAVPIAPSPSGRTAPRDSPRWTRWSGRGGSSGASTSSAQSDPFKALANYYQTAVQQSSATFVLMPNEEILRGPVAAELGAHNDILVSHPVYWEQGRRPDQPLFEPSEKVGRIYHIGSAADMMEMTHRENMLIYMPHPRSKGSTGFPDAIKDTPHFLDPNFRGAGFRWGMGLDGSERRLCEYRCLPALDDMNNWIADTPGPPKFLQAISELYQQGYGDDVYANNPVNYVMLDTLPPPGDWTPIVNAMKAGNYFISSGEVLVPSYTVEGAGAKRTIVADVQWTFPLEFVEVVWGDGQRTDRQIIPATEFPAFGRHQFRIPFNAAGRKWVRFAAWDSAGDGALVQPVKLVP